MKSARSAVVGVLAIITLLGVPLFAFAASMRGGGASSDGAGGTQTIHVRLDQPSGGVASGTVGYVASGGGGDIFSADFVVTSGDLAAGSVSGTVTVTAGAPPTVYCIQVNFTGTVTPGGAGVGGFAARVPSCDGFVDGILFGVQLDAGHISFSP